MYLCKVFVGAAFLVAPFSGLHAQSLKAKKIGVVLMHGKWGKPQGLAKIAKSLRSAGVIVDRPKMPWSRSRAYAKSYEASLAEIDKAISRLKAKGAKRCLLYTSDAADD